MANNDIVKDSSVWYQPQSFAAVNKKDNAVRIGIVRRAYYDEVVEDLVYHVQIQDKTDKIEARCRLLRKFGGIFNYEDTVLRGYNYTEISKDPQKLDAKAGDIVLVAYIGGENRDGVILGGLTHPGRAVALGVDKGPQMASEFNGIETTINPDGEYTVTFKGQPTNLTKLGDIPTTELPAPIYDAAVGTSFLKFDKTGSFQVNDNSKSGAQLIKIDKPNGKIMLVSGDVTVVLNKGPQDISVKTRSLNIVSDNSITEKTKEYKMNASSYVKINTPKVAIGTDGIELLNEIVKLVEAIAKVKPISPVGICTAMGTTPEWPDVDAIKAKIEQIKGTL